MFRKVVPVLLLLSLALLFPSLAVGHTSSSDTKPELRPAGLRPAGLPSVSREGRLVLLEATSKDGGHITLMTLLSGEKQFVLRGERDGLRAGQSVRIEGLLDKSKSPFQTQGLIFVDDFKIKSKARAARSITGSRGAMIAFVSWSGSGISGYDAHGENLADLGAWSEAVSDGAFRWDPVTRVNLILPEPLEDCVAYEGKDAFWSAAVRERLSELGYDLDDYRALGIALPKDFGAACVPTAYAYVAGDCLWGATYWCNLSVYSYEYSGYEVFVHELGHTLTLPHANQAPCFENDGLPIPLTYEGFCNHIEYGDRYDPMGTSFSNAMYNPVFSYGLDWIKEEEMINLEETSQSSSETITLSPYGGLSGTRVVRIEMPPVEELGEASPGELYLEYRANSGLDSVLYDGSDIFPYIPCLAYTPDHNLFLRYSPSPAAAEKLDLVDGGIYGMVDSSYLLDMRPETGTACDAGLRPGFNWSDPSTRLKVEYLARDSDLASATIRITREPGDYPPALLSLRKASKQSDPTRKADLRFWLESDQPLDDESLTLTDFSVVNGDLLGLEPYAGETGVNYLLRVQGRDDGEVRVAPSASFAVRDLFGNEITTLNSVSLRLDRFIKAPRLVGKPKRLTSARKAVFRWRRDPEATYFCALRSQPLRKCASGKTYKGLSRRRHLFRLEARDAAGNSDSLTYRWRIR